MRKYIYFLEDGTVTKKLGMKMLGKLLPSEYIHHFDNALKAIEEIEKVGSDDIVLIISDGSMGGGNKDIGYLCEYLRDKHLSIPIIISSSNKYDHLLSDNVKQLLSRDGTAVKIGYIGSDYALLKALWELNRGDGKGFDSLLEDINKKSSQRLASLIKGELTSIGSPVRSPMVQGGHLLSPLDRNRTIPNSPALNGLPVLERKAKSRNEKDKLPLKSDLLVYKEVGHSAFLINKQQKLLSLAEVDSSSVASVVKTDIVDSYVPVALGSATPSDGVVPKNMDVDSRTIGGNTPVARVEAKDSSFKLIRKPIRKETLWQARGSNIVNRLGARTICVSSQNPIVRDDKKEKKSKNTAVQRLEEQRENGSCCHCALL